MPCFRLNYANTENCQWNKYGYGTPAYKNVFSAAVEAAQNQRLLFSFSLGANQGQGSPAEMESEGLAKELVSLF
jgi:hypothetical protein